MSQSNSKLIQVVSHAIAELEKYGDDLSKLPHPLQIVVRVHSAQGVLDNGGLQYFFEADFPDIPPYSVFTEAYREIGAIEEAELLEAAVALFPFADPHKFVDRRTDFLDTFKDEDGDAINSPFEGPLNNLCGNKRVWRRLLEFAARHREHFPMLQTRH